MALRILFCLVLVSLVAGVSACGEEDEKSGEGNVNVTVYGEDFIEKGIPAEEMSDGWAVTFDKFVISVGDIVVGGSATPEIEPLDISVETDGEGHPIATLVLPAGSYSDAAFAITRVEAAGSATKDGTTKTFDWVFDQKTSYSACDTTTSVADGETATFQITVHADHFFYDSLVSEDPALVFQGLADADADEDGAITKEELENADVGSYDIGSAGDVTNLWEWLIAQGRTLGHVDGEGHCDSASE